MPLDEAAVKLSAGSCFVRMHWTDPTATMAEGEAAGEFHFKASILFPL